MKVLIISFFALLLVLNPLIHAQEAETAAGSLKALHLYFINGYAISYKFKSDGKSAFRIRADININQNDGDTEYESHTITDSYTSNSNSTGKSNSISVGLNLSPQYAYTFYYSSPAKMYIGGGPFLGYSYRKSRTEDDYELNDRKTLNTSTRNSYSTGIKGFIGIECMVTHSIALFAESELSGGYNWSENNETSKINESVFTSDSDYSSSSKSWFYNLENVKIGVGIYF